MQRFFPVFLIIAFLLRGFVGDAMAVAMTYDTSLPVQAAAGIAATVTPSCHTMEQNDGATDESGKTTPMDHTHCQWCCAAIALPSIALLTFDRTSTSSPVTFTPTFASNNVLPAFEPPIL